MNANQSFAVMIGGPAGAGLNTIESILIEALDQAGFFLFSSKEFMSRIRGGSNSVQIRLGDGPVAAPAWHADLYFALDGDSLFHAGERIDATTIVIGDKSVADAYPDICVLDLGAKGRELGGRQFLNTYAAGIVFGLLGLGNDTIEKAVGRRFEAKEQASNLAALTAGIEEGAAMVPPLHRVLPDLSGWPRRDAGGGRYLDGTQACGFGFLAGGCNFVSSYPMSPSTGVLNFMARHSRELTILVEQAEDEIAAFNMVLGAWYAGGRGITTTSGGGFALMGEGISLSGMTETPAVVYLAQRPGPATGLPTRTEQGDLNLAIHSGHGDFPRIVLAPGDGDECIEAGYLSMELADRFQVPVIVLSDQHLADSVQAVGAVDFSAFEQNRTILQSGGEYRRYELTDSGISPRAVPGYGEGLVCCTSDEHDERGQITESYRMRERMVEKRQKRHRTILDSALPPMLRGEGNIAVVGWGSTKKVIEEALARLGDRRLFQLHFHWVHPIDARHLGPLKKEGLLTVVIENNADGQFANLLRQHGVGIDHTILQSNGFPFFVDQLTLRLKTLLKEHP